jgi:hypothetical protein
MLISRECPYTGKTNTLDLSVSQISYNQWLLGEKTAEDAFQNLPKDLIAFIKDGILPQEQPDSYEQW